MERNGVVMMALWCSLSGCACETVKSSDIKTSGLFADLQADAPSTTRLNVKATLTLGQGSLTFLELSQGDLLTATVGSTNRAMQRTSLLGSTWYEAGFDGDTTGASVKIALARQSDTSAPESNVTLPPTFAFTSPNPNAAFPRTDGVTVTWGATGSDAMHLSAKGSCINLVDAALSSDTGTHAFVPFVPSSGNEGKACDVLLTLVRTRTGTLDAAYGKGGSFKATVTRTLTISSTP